VIDLYPDEAELAKKDESGLRWSYDPDGCCEIRKVIPLAKALAGYDASLTGRKAFQNSERAQLPRFEVDTSDAAGRLKIKKKASLQSAVNRAHTRSHLVKIRALAVGRVGTRPNAVSTSPARMKAICHPAMSRFCKALIG